ncbi:hypothetical protein PIB30_023864 [Stylosanthes scabra]|uniref:Uncharacterized protein n=1 Tax=Stylosanthes scabra TaxID=79078 RepID=A0ABU6S931_9FABA|nr:hypothetical protein [Stylosanthes scabra]
MRDKDRSCSFWQLSSWTHTYHYKHRDTCSNNQPQIIILAAAAGGACNARTIGEPNGSSIWVEALWPPLGGPRFFLYHSLYFAGLAVEDGGV